MQSKPCHYTDHYRAHGLTLHAAHTCYRVTPARMADDISPLGPESRLGSHGPQCKPEACTDSAEREVTARGVNPVAGWPGKSC